MIILRKKKFSCTFKGSNNLMCNPQCSELKTFTTFFFYVLCPLRRLAVMVLHNYTCLVAPRSTCPSTMPTTSIPTFIDTSSSSILLLKLDKMFLPHQQMCTEIFSTLGSDHLLSWPSNRNKYHLVVPVRTPIQFHHLGTDKRMKAWKLYYWVVQKTHGFVV